MKLKCTKCLETKERDDFHNNKLAKNGKEYHCKVCRKNEEKKPEIFFPEENKKICSKCTIKKDLTEFTKNKNLRGGVSYQCKKCASNAHKIKASKKERSTEGQKKCRKCEEVKSFSNFSKSVTNTDGYINMCKGCNRKRDRKKAADRKRNKTREKWELYTTESFKKELKRKFKGEFTLVGEYLKGGTCILHESCGNTKCYTKFPKLEGIGCKTCSSKNRSELSTIIENTLREIGAKYKTEVSFKDCINKRELYFDFAIYKDKKIILIIEADGVQHFKEVEYFKDSLKEVQKRDKIKTDYCRDNNIPLLRISYKQQEYARRIVIENVNPDVHKKQAKSYFNRLGLSEEESLTIKELYAEENYTLNQLKREFGFCQRSLKNILEYKYFPEIGLHLREKIKSRRRGFKSSADKVNARKLWGRLPSEIEEEEVEKIIEARKNGYSFKRISKEFNIVYKFIHKEFEWKSRLIEISITTKKCRHKDTRKEFESLAEACRHFGYKYKLESERIGRGNPKASFEYI